MIAFFFEKEMNGAQMVLLIVLFKRQLQHIKKTFIRSEMYMSTSISRGLVNVDTCSFHYGCSMVIGSCNLRHERSLTSRMRTAIPLRILLLLRSWHCAVPKSTYIQDNREHLNLLLPRNHHWFSILHGLYTCIPLNYFQWGS